MGTLNSSTAETPAKASSAQVFPLTLLCLSRSWGGLEINTARFAHWMQQRGWPVQLLTLPDSPLAARATELAIPVVLLRNRWKAVDIGAAKRLADILRTFQTRVLIVTRNGDLGLAVLCKTGWLPSLRLVYQQHMQLGLSKRGLLHTLRYRALDAWLTPLPGLAQQVLAKTRLPAERLHVVPLGLELAKFRDPGCSQAQARAQLGLALPPGTVLLGLVGRFDSGKGQRFVVKAFARLRQQYPQLQLLFVGESTRNEGNAYQERVLARVRALGLEQVVHVRPFTASPEMAYQALDIALVASTNETYGMVTLEAMAAGLPVVAAAAGGTMELVADGQTGLLFPLRDQVAFGAAIVRLLPPSGWATQLGQQAQTHVQATYSHQQQCAQTEQVLHAITS
jgi:D-inositol-3-phosphate glycosyltransferase